MARIIDAFTQFFDNAGDPLINGKLRFLETGTNNADKTTFADSGQTVPNTNPLILDGAGRCSSAFGTGVYKVVLLTSADQQIAQFDPVGGTLTGGQFDSFVLGDFYDKEDTVQADNGQYYRSLINGNQGFEPSANAEQWELLQFGRVYNQFISYTNKDSVYDSLGDLYKSLENDNLGNPPASTTAWAKVASEGNAIVRIPINLAPADGFAHSSENPTLTASEYANLYGNAHASSQFFIYDSTGNSVIYDSGVIGPVETHDSTAGLSLNTNYKWNVKYNDDEGNSSVSLQTDFSVPTAEVLPPFNIIPVDEQTNVEEIDLVLSGSVFDAIGGAQIHNASQWQVATDIGFTSIVFDSGTDVVNLTTNSSITGLTDGETTFFWRVRYSGSVTGFSVYSIPFSFVTPVEFFLSNLAVAHSGSPSVSVYPFYVSGFGTKLSDPATLPSGSGTGAQFTAGGFSLAVSHGGSPFISAYPFSDTGFGTKFSDPSTLPAGSGQDVAFNHDGTAIAIGHSGSPFVTAYPWSPSGFGTKFSDPSVAPTGIGNGVTFNNDGTVLAVAHSITPFVTAYPFSDTGFGTKFSDPGTLPTALTTGISFSDDGNEIAVSYSGSPFVTAYAFSGSGFGSKFSDPSTLPASFARGVSFNGDSSVVAVAHSGSPFVTAYPWSPSGFGTKISNPASLPVATSNGVEFNHDDSVIVLATDNTPFVTAYPWSPSGFGTKFSDPGTLPSSTANGVSFSKKSN